MLSIRAEEPLPEGKFDPAHYCAVHRHLFQDVYIWAGKYRTVRTAKDGNSFCYPDHIATQMDGLFEALNGAAFLPGVPRHTFAEAAAHFLWPLGQQFIADTQYFGHAVCVFMRRAKQKAWRGGQDYLGNIHEQKIPYARRGIGRIFLAFWVRCARSRWWRGKAG
ncbi:Fic family protein [Sphingorhabdus sp.]|uniref:Fic family protein n=1 Tax=Sphingorhabdus sp. TaxID=1902408 RepID=UPI0037833F44